MNETTKDTEDHTEHELTLTPIIGYAVSEAGESIYPLVVENQAISLDGTIETDTMAPRAGGNDSETLHPVAIIPATVPAWLVQTTTPTIISVGVTHTLNLDHAYWQVRADYAIKEYETGQAAIKKEWNEQ